MRLLSSATLLSFVFVTIVGAPLSAEAATTIHRRSLRSSESSETISRGAFIKEAVEKLGLSSQDTENVHLPYGFIPVQFTQSITIAHQRNALRVFGRRLSTTAPITRIEALRVVVELLDLHSTKNISFRDVVKGTMEEKAAKVAMEYGWISPVQSKYFGAKQRLTKGEAAIILTKSAALSRASKKAKNSSLPTFKINVQGKAVTSRSASSFPKSDLLETVWTMLNNEYLYEDKLDQDEVAYEALEAIVDSLDDPYTKFMRPVSAQNFQTQIAGKVSGIGAQVEERDGVVTVVTPLRGSPAERSGVKPSDQIIAVDGQLLKGVEFMDAVNMIRGERGTTVELTINRSGIEIKLIVLRDVVKVPEIEITWHGNIAIVKLMQFGKLTDAGLRAEMVKIQEQNPKGIILDVRNNPGGLLHAASNVVSNFLPKGTPFAKIVSKNSERIDKTEFPPTIDPKVPVIVLVNEGSASASEIVAGALQDHKRAKLVGNKTFGKGTVQQVVQFTDKSNLKMTVSEWFTPNGTKINEEGVHPDYKVDYINERDAQMLKALDLLR